MNGTSARTSFRFLGTETLTHLASGPGSFNFNWTYADGIIATDLNNATFSVGPGGRLGVGVVSTFDPVNMRYTDDLLIMTRLQ